MALAVKDATAYAGDRTVPTNFDFDPGVPTDGLVALWRGGGGITLDANGKVSSWEDFNGQLASQSNPALRPAPGTKAVNFSGTTYLTTGLFPQPDAGYIVAQITRTANNSGTVVSFMIGAGGTTGGVGTKIGLGFTTDGKVCGQVGSLNANSFRGTTVVPVGATVVVGIYWKDGVASLRLNGAVEKQDSYTGATYISTRPLFIGGANGFGGLANASADILLRLGIYGGASTDVQRTAIDAAFGQP